MEKWRVAFDGGTRWREGRIGGGEGDSIIGSRIFSR